MTEERRAQIGVIVNRFRDAKIITQDLINEFCSLNKFDPVTVGELEDYTAQVIHDEKLDEVLPLVLNELQRMMNRPEFTSQTKRKEALERNNEIRINIAKVFEDCSVNFNDIDGFGRNLGGALASIVTGAATIIYNKGFEVVMHIAKAKFGGSFNAKNAAEYSENVIKKHFEEKQRKADKLDENKEKAESDAE